MLPEEERKEDEMERKRKPEAKEIFSIPNLMGYARILLIPVILYSYYHAESTADYYRVAGIVMISTITDLLDGFVARKFHMVTELGKFVDPLADKLTHGALVICLASRYRLMLALIVLMVVKEGFMIVMGLIKIRKYGRKLDGAMWFGKVCTTVLFLTTFVLILFPQIPPAAADVLILTAMAVMACTLVLYIPVFAKMK